MLEVPLLQNFILFLPASVDLNLKVMEKTDKNKERIENIFNTVNIKMRNLTLEFFIYLHQFFHAITPLKLNLLDHIDHAGKVFKESLNLKNVLIHFCCEEWAIYCILKST